VSLVVPNILIVDDEDIVRHSCVKILSSEWYQTKIASNGLDALGKLKAEQFDMALVDLMLPDMPGIDLLKKIKEEWHETEVVIITGYGTVKTAVDALKYKAYDYIEKPFSPEILLNAVKRCLEKKRLLSENLRLRHEINTFYSLENIIGTSKEMQKVFKLISNVAPTGSTVLITGESGTGKELVARAIHHNSARREQPFMVVDCGAIPENLMESEMFGQTKGSFTGAVAIEKDIIEAANGGIVFLDEISNLPLSMQVKLLRVLQEKEFRPVGSKKTFHIDIRFIAATNRDLSMMVRGGIFREDLFYRLNVFPIHLPPLRDRKEDISTLACHFLHKYSKETGKDISHISAAAVRRLIAHDWPGNVRELENAIHRATIICKGNIIEPAHILISLNNIEEEEIPNTLNNLKKVKKNIERQVYRRNRAKFPYSRAETEQLEFNKVSK